MKHVSSRHMLSIALLIAVIGGAASAAAQLQLSIGTVRAPSPGEVSVPLHLIRNAAAPSTLVVRLAYDAPLLRPVAVTLSPAAAAKKSSSYLVKNNLLNIVIYGGVKPLEDGLLAELIFAVSADAPPGQNLTISGAEINAAAPDGTPIDATVSPGTIQTETKTGQHSADFSRDWAISLSELLRCIQFFNAHAFRCAPGTEDGYAPLAGDQSCAAHNSDYAPHDWDLNLSELLRLVQFFNSPGGSYHPDPAGEDGFFPGPF